MTHEKLKDITSLSTFRYPFPKELLKKTDEMRLFIEKFWKLNRTAVNKDTDKLVEYLKKELDADIVEANSCEECLSWIIPENWNVIKGQLRTKEGDVIVDFNENPLYLWTHSTSFKGEISREELFDKHISTNINMPDDIVYHYNNGYKYKARDWGFSIPYNILKNMDDSSYIVDIETELKYNNTLKVVDAFLPGRKDETIFFMAHTCHPAQVSDGIGNIAIAIEEYNYLKSLNERKYSYRFLFGPEYFASAAYLSKAHKSKIDNLRYGIYLDMLSNHELMGFQSSMQGNSLIDCIVKNIFKNHLINYLEKPYRKLWGNDEMFFNGNSFMIPMIGIGRGMHRDYHHSSDNLENVDLYHLAESVWILRRIIEAFEKDFIPSLNYKGPLYLSRYGLEFNVEIMKNIEIMQVLANGKNSCVDIALELDMDIFLVLNFFHKLNEKGLIQEQGMIK